MSRLDERRAAFQRYKQDVQQRGKPFFPYAMFHDTVMSFVVVSVIAGLAIIWKFTADGTEGGWLGPLYADKADPGTTNFIPRPDWYFYFLFYLLRIFKWPESVVLGTVGIPTILLILLFALPFIDLRRERRLLRRPVAVVAAALTALSMGVLTYKGATARESLSTEAVEAVDEWATRQGFAGNEEAVEGARLFAGVGCLNCHSYLGTGQALAPVLDDIGRRRPQGVEGFVAFLKNPPQAMLQFRNLGDENLRAIATFLDASKGEQGG